jgi:hypothetical protein
VAFSYDLTTDRGKLRLLIGDTATTKAEAQIFTDEEIDAFLALEGSDLKLAAARALEAMAASQVMILKVIRLLDLQTDGAAVSRELRAQAKELRAEAESDGEFDFAEWTVDGATWAERLRAEALREG